VVIVACVALVLLGVMIVIKWGGPVPETSVSPVSTMGGSPNPGSEGLLKYVLIAFSVGPVAAVLAAGAGGRLVMRLLAATSPEAKGRLTEAGEVVGRITAGGTLGFIFFAAFVGGIVSGVFYVLVGPGLPRGRAGGAALGVLLLVVAGSRLEPLVPTNPDFGLVGPAWLSVLAFTTLGLFQGMLMAALAAWARARLGVSPHRWRPRLITVDRIAVLGVLLVALPGFVTALGDILNAG
jgi:hypothetical protein